MRYLNPITDFAFKKIFGSPESSDILLSFLNAVLGLAAPWHLVSITIEDPYLAPKIKGMKDSFVDVRAKDGNGKQYVIEMQVLPVIGFEQRILYNACKTYAGQIRSGEDYRLLNDVIALTITDFVMFEHPDLVSKYRLRDEAGREYGDDLELIFVELPKFTKAETELANLLDKWCYFLRHAKSLQEVPPSLAQEQAIGHAFAIANRAQMSTEELELQEKREMYLQDQRGALDFARLKGEEIGMAKGEEIGMAKGAQQQARMIAQNLLRAGLPVAQIAQATGLDEAEVADMAK